MRVYSVCLWKYDISGSRHVDLISNFFVPCISTRNFIQYIITLSGCSTSMNIREGNG